jgi:tetratricopeptide (TPR) repeat protein
LTHKPDDAVVHYNLGIIFKDRGQVEAAVASYRQAVSLQPEMTEAPYNLGLALVEQGKLDDAAICYQRSATLDPNDAKSHLNLGLALLEQGKLDEAVASYERALTFEPDNAEAEMSLVFAQLYRSDVTLADILARSRRWDARHAAPVSSCRHSRPSTDESNRRPRIGLVSADFCCHPVGFLTVPAIEGLARAGFHLTCYSNGGKQDALTIRFADTATEWRTVTTLSDDALAHMIQADRIACWRSPANLHPSRLPHGWAIQRPAG